MQEDIASAMGLTGQVVMGQAIMVKSAEVRYIHPVHNIPHQFCRLRLGDTAPYLDAGDCSMSPDLGASGLQAEKNLAWEAAQAQSASVAQMSSLATAGAGPCKLYIKNLHPNITVRPPASHAPPACRPCDMSAAIKGCQGLPDSRPYAVTLC